MKYLHSAKLVALSHDVVRASWPPYRDASIVTEAVPVEPIAPLARSVDRQRLASAVRMLGGLVDSGLKPYAGHLQATADGIRVCFPPVLERHDNQLLVVDGMHRVMAAAHLGGGELTAIVVSSPTLPPPTVPPCRWRDVAVVDYKPPRAEKFPGYAPELFRPTAKILDGLGGPYPGVDEALDALRRAVTAAA